MRFTKVKHRNGETTLVWLDSEDGCQHRHEVTSTETPEPEFRNALAALGPHVGRLLELPPDYGLEVAGISLRYGDDDRYGVVVTAVKEVEGSTSPFVINSPTTKSPDVDDTRPQMSEAFGKAVDEVLALAARFVDGKRAQGELFDAA